MVSITSVHKKEFGVKPEIVASAPGNINLMGEYTEPFEGYVLPLAIDRRVFVSVSRRKDNSLRFYAADLNERKRTGISTLKYKREDRWANYLKGVVFLLLQAGIECKGLNITLSGKVPQGIGLASSAAIISAFFVAVRKLLSIRLADDQIIKLSRQVESQFLGKNTGISDHLVSFSARKNKLMYIDTRSLDTAQLPLNLNSSKLIITNPKIPVTSYDLDHSEHFKDCQSCVEILSKKYPGNSLRDFSKAELGATMGLIPESTRRKCMHILDENSRVLECKKLLEVDDIAGVGRLLTRSHESIRDQYEASYPEIDWLVKRATEIEGIHGAKMTGENVSGCTIMLVDNAAMDLYIEQLEEYERIFGFQPEYFECTPSNGVTIESV